MRLPCSLPLPVKRALRLFHVQQVRGIQARQNDGQPCRCLNCGTTFAGNYCPRCGQHRNIQRYRFSSILRKLAAAFFNIDHGFRRTLVELIYRPGYLIDDFLRGKRVNYFQPFQTLFVLAALYLMTVQLVDPSALVKKTDKELTAEEWTEMRKELTDKLKQADTDSERRLVEETLALLDQQIGNQLPTDSVGADQEPPTPLLSKIMRIDQWRESFSRSPYLSRVWGLLENWIKGNKAFSILLTVPLFAMASWCVFRRKSIRRRYNLTEHVFIQTFIACQILLLSILAVPVNGQAAVNDLYDVPVVCIYLLFCYDHCQLYRISAWRSCRYTLLMFFLSLLILILGALVIVGIAYLLLL